MFSQTHAFAAGCDDLDSDGDGEYDVCEDRFPPELVVRDAEIFRGDESDMNKLCYTEKVFNSVTQVKNFLEFHFPATDDCSPTSKLSVNITYESGSCYDTVYSLTPSQNISACDGRSPVGAFEIPFENPLFGNAREVTVQLDEEAPVVQCGFNSDASTTNEVDGKTLYHYMQESDMSGVKLADAGFVFDVTVSMVVTILMSSMKCLDSSLCPPLFVTCTL